MMLLSLEYFYFPIIKRSMITITGSKVKKKNIFQTIRQ